MSLCRFLNGVITYSMNDILQGWLHLWKTSSMSDVTLHSLHGYKSCFMLSGEHWPANREPWTDEQESITTPRQEREVKLKPSLWVFFISIVYFYEIRFLPFHVSMLWNYINVLYHWWYMYLYNYKYAMSWYLKVVLLT